MTEREQQKEERRMKILGAGLELFTRKGYAATKVEDLANAAQMSAGLLFHYFPSKEALYLELVRMGLEGTRLPLNMEFSNPMAFFEGFVKQLFTSVRQNPWIVKMFVLMAQAQRSDATPEAVRKLALQTDTMQLSVGIIQKGQEAGEIRTGDPLALSCAFWCSVQGIMEQLAADPSMPLPEVCWITDILRNKEN